MSIEYSIRFDQFVKYPEMLKSILKFWPQNLSIWNMQVQDHLFLEHPCEPHQESFKLYQEHFIFLY